MKELKDYLHLYLGCKVEYGYEETKRIGTLVGKDDLVGWQVNTYKVLAPYQYVRDELIKPILRPLSDMTEDEKNNLSWEWKVDYDFKPIFRPDQFLFLLSKNFDLFGLIESGLAIDITTLK